MNLMQHALVIAAACVACAAPAADSPTPAVTSKPLKRLDRIYLMVHALNWLEITPDDPRRKTDTWEQWPGRCEICHQYEFGLKEKYERLMGTPDGAAGVFVLPSGMQGDPPLIELAQRTFGDRCVVCPLGYDQAANRQALGEEFGRGLNADRERAQAVRGQVTDAEVAAWERSKAWATYLITQLEARGYTFDRAAVGMIVLGEDWCGCAATFPIHMGRAFGLQQPIVRRFDLINPDCSLLLLLAKPLEQNLAMAHGVRLFLFQTADGRYAAQYWEGMHGLWDPPHVVTVDFPPHSVRPVNVHGKPRGDGPGGQLRMSVGCGGHTPFRSDLVQAEPALPLAEFRRALLAGTVSDVPAGM